MNQTIAGGNILPSSGTVGSGGNNNNVSTEMDTGAIPGSIGSEQTANEATTSSQQPTNVPSTTSGRAAVSNSDSESEESFNLGRFSANR